jgi:lipid-A-disaccharide synthase-like uncharacterized protein
MFVLSLNSAIIIQKEKFKENQRKVLPGTFWVFSSLLGIQKSLKCEGDSKCQFCTI